MIFNKTENLSEILLNITINDNINYEKKYENIMLSQTNFLTR